MLIWRNQMEWEHQNQSRDVNASFHRLALDSVPPPPSIFEMHIFFARQDKFYV